MADDQGLDATRHSSENSRQVFPLNHRFADWYRVAAPVSGLVAVAVTLIGGPDRVTAVVAGITVLIAAGAIPGGNATAAFHTGFGPVLLALGLLQLGLVSTGANVLHASVVDTCTILGLGVVVALCGMYQWRGDEDVPPDQHRRDSVAQEVKPEADSHP